MNAVGHSHRVRSQTRGPRQAALPFVLMALVFVAGATSTFLPAGLAFALVSACVLVGSLRVLLAYRDGLVARRVRSGQR